MHPWVNGIILVQDPEGIPIERVTESGSIESAELNASQGDKIAELDDFIFCHVDIWSIIFE